MIELTEQQYTDLKGRLGKLLKVGIRPKKIKSIRVNPANHALPPMTIEVGKVCKTLEPNAPPEKVLAIFEATTFLVCTERRGIKEGLPYFFIREDVREVREF